ncbi:MAG: lysophospholipid acyltransferase family protein [Anaerolineales bacterium]|nr:1-acyl-sn-glycerol-3-phosphate acyltransferase [Anaerolineales bacterium]MCS7247558.1 1-acyl-sn-glycerol-3-phosphate acyltransferase [Anaerolineales bacterium]MDW8161369.1 lysophospholipid acyltransferase family protein [Anaerolineales bacterium]MDW8447976.1 lysophospholipid acyltransferase family protein [Anaerolineales bacterium]
MNDRAFSYRVPRINRVARQIMRPIFRSLYFLLSSMHIQGMENVPKNGAYVVAFNHVSLYDVPFLLTFWPTELEAIGAVEVWQRMGQNIFAHLYYGIQIHRNRYDRRALEQGLSVLARGTPLLIAPEGGRTHRPGLCRAYPGIAFLVEKARVPVVPVGIVGATADFLLRVLRLERPRLEMNIGKPLYLPPLPAKGKARRRARQRNADQVMLAIAALLPPEYRGVYSNFSLPLEEGLDHG